MVYIFIPYPYTNMYVGTIHKVYSFTLSLSLISRSDVRRMRRECVCHSHDSLCLCVMESALSCHLAIRHRSTRDIYLRDVSFVFSYLVILLLDVGWAMRAEMTITQDDRAQYAQYWYDDGNIDTQTGTNAIV